MSLRAKRGNLPHKKEIAASEKHPPREDIPNFVFIRIIRSIRIIRVKNSCYAAMKNGLSFPLILTFSQREKGLSPLSFWERAEGEGSPNVCHRHLLRNIS